MKKIKSVSYVIICFLIIFLMGCSNKNASDGNVEATNMPKSVAMVFHGSISDGGFNQFKYEGLLRAEKDKNIKVAYKDNVPLEKQEEVIGNFANDGYDIIIGQGAQFGEALSKVADEFKEKQFIVSVSTNTHEKKNMTATNISYQDAGYLGGVMSAITTKNRKVAMIVGEWYDEHVKMKNSFLDGVKSIDKNIETKIVDTESWNDEKIAEDAANDLISEGYDVIFFCIDNAYKGILRACKNKENIYVVSSIIDTINEAPENCVGSIVYNWEEVGYMEATGAFEKGKSYEYGVKDDFINIQYGKNFPTERIAEFVNELDKLKKK